MQIRFGAFALDDERLQLTREGRPVELRPKVFDLLATLLRERHRVVRREELFGRLWSTTAVGAGSLSGLVNELRSALGENGRGPSSIRTVHARGYQFAAQVEVETSGSPSDAPSASIPSPLGMAPSADPCAATAAPIDTALERPRARIGDALRAALTEVRRSGARALVASIPGRRERTAWLACAAAEAVVAGFRPRWAAIPEGPIERVEGAGGTGSAAADGEGRNGFVDVPGASPVREPIALCLDIEDPGDWGRAGGLRRFLDLLGRAPVLVIAALPTRLEASVVRELAAPDVRVEWLGETTDGVLPGNGTATENPTSSSPGDLALALLALARADRTAFEAALRSMGFESLPSSPIRALRRVEPSPAWAPERLDAEVG